MSALKKEFASLNKLRTRALVATSEAGQIADMATGARYVADTPTRS